MQPNTEHLSIPINFKQFKRHSSNLKFLIEQQQKLSRERIEMIITMTKKESTPVNATTKGT